MSYQHFMDDKSLFSEQTHDFVATAICFMMKDAVHECDPKGQVTLPVENSSNIHQGQVPCNYVSNSEVIIIFFLQFSRHSCSSQTPCIFMLISQIGALNDDWLIFNMLTTHKGILLLNKSLFKIKNIVII